MLTDRQAIELFHLHFLRLLCAGPDKGRHAIKGGCNLRFFFGSVRYSEDLDLDTSGLPVYALREKVSRLLAGPALAMALDAQGIALGPTSAPKQTETTQRWKIALLPRGSTTPLHTRVEFSRRATLEQPKTEPVDAGLLSQYRLMPLLLPHYLLDAAIRQKVGALVGRATAQARDVFDLATLFARAAGKVDALAGSKAQLPRAIERAMQISYDEFRSAVASFFAPEDRDLYGSREAWDAMVEQVVDRLEAAS